jgi:thiamine biosynthesis lipoprotein ApbE
MPARALVSAAVIASSATLADALSTAAVVLGAGASRAALRRVGAEGVLVDLGDDGQVAVAATTGARFRRLEEPTQEQARRAAEE